MELRRAAAASAVFDDVHRRGHVSLSLLHPSRHGGNRRRPLNRPAFEHPRVAGASYNVKISRGRLLLIADGFNVFNTQTVLDYNSFSELAARVPNPDFGAAGVSGVASGQQFTTPRQVRIGVRYEF
jgi:hypothetical protein